MANKKNKSTKLWWNETCFSSFLFSSQWYFFPSFGRGSRFASSDICSVHLCEAWGQAQRSTTRFYLPQRVSGARRPSWNIHPGHGQWKWQMYNTEFNSLYAKCPDPLQPFSCFFRCTPPLTTYPSNGRAKQICTAALPTVQKSQIPQFVSATLWLKRGTMRLQVSEWSSWLEPDV